MKKRIFSLLLALLLATIPTTFAFAESLDSALDETSKSIAIQSIEDAVDMDSVASNLEMEGDYFTIDGDSTSVKIPINADGEVNLNSESCEDISMSLPKEFENVDGINYDGTIVYNSEKADVAIGVQAIEGTTGEYMVRGLITINGSDASKDYSFDFNLPQGYSLIRGEDYGNKLERMKGYVYIVNNNNVIIDNETGESYPESVYAVEPAWAKDANGNSVETSFEISGNTLIQHIEFDEASVFPIVADPQYGGYYYTKSNVTYSNDWGSGKRCSDNLKAKKGETGTISCTKTVTVTGSVSGKITGIETIGIGGSYSTQRNYTLTFKGPATKYMIYKPYYKVEKGTRVKRLMSSGKSVSSNSYTVKKCLHGQYALKNA